ncbi:hypothetical protein NDU88_001930 [Pleurodeles waltl]|uniref:Uncharacterized protein n=1 Tax=Pleurodeles waltl TaxID=8319 RepID=A0AAV7TK66_PLEWA|nr:hypothetical protein NDU88_001930 [Pleurodeles waltl]
MADGVLLPRLQAPARIPHQSSTLYCALGRQVSFHTEGEGMQPSPLPPDAQVPAVGAGIWPAHVTREKRSQSLILLRCPLNVSKIETAAQRISLGCARPLLINGYCGRRASQDSLMFEPGAPKGVWRNGRGSWCRIAPPP